MLITRRAVVSGMCSIGALTVFGGAAAFLSGNRELLRPPGGQDEEEFVGACIRCGRCLSECPLNCVQPAALSDGIINARTPYLDFKRGYCDFCGKCSEACPTESLKMRDATSARIGIAVVNAEKCVSCEQCIPACVYDALTWSVERRLPIVDEALCNGCGACEFKCPSTSLSYYDGDGRRAIRVVRSEVRA